MRQTIAATLALLLFGTQAHAQTSVVLSPTEDASLGYHDNFNSASTNYNSTIHYSAYAQPGAQGGINKGRGAMDFDLTGIPAGSTVLGAFLSLSAIGPFGVGDVAAIGRRSKPKPTATYHFRLGGQHGYLEHAAYHHRTERRPS
ncbi:MAG: hypothetical protein IPI07_06610 [Flavobacteriales bacterium]|nr:hypothetical protein [Flavobacteriales bacterium]